MDKLVSIIIPVYNAELYIRKCLDSVLEIQYDNLQIILIDDGSTDKSGDICDEYVSKYKNMEIYHINNQGVSHARNVGLTKVKGQYVMFIDSDDYIERNYVKALLPEIKDQFVYSAHIYLNSELKLSKNAYKEQKYSLSYLRNNIEQVWGHSPWMYVTGACYLTRIIVENRIMFNENKTLGEDTEFNFEYLNFVQQIRTVNECVYIHRINKNSLVHQLYFNRCEKEKKECKSFEKFACKNLYRLRWNYWHITLQHFYEHLNIKEQLVIKKEIKKSLKKTFKDSYFRESLGYIRKNGSVDEKIRSFFMKYYLYRFYPYIMKIFTILYKIKLRIKRKKK